MSRQELARNSLCPLPETEIWKHLSVWGNGNRVGLCKRRKSGRKKGKLANCLIPLLESYILIVKLPLLASCCSKYKSSDFAQCRQKQHRCASQQSSLALIQYPSAYRGELWRYMHVHTCMHVPTRRYLLTIATKNISKGAWKPRAPQYFLLFPGQKFLKAAWKPRQTS